MSHSPSSILVKQYFPNTLGMSKLNPLFVKHFEIHAWKVLERCQRIIFVCLVYLANQKTFTLLFGIMRKREKTGIRGEPEKKWLRRKEDRRVERAFSHCRELGWDLGRARVSRTGGMGRYVNDTLFQRLSPVPCSHQIWQLHTTPYCSCVFVYICALIS